MTVEELRAAIEAHPRHLYEALEAIDKAEKTIEKLNEQIEEEEAAANLLPQDTSSNENGRSEIERQEAALKIEHELALLELSYEQLKGLIELDYRRNPPEGEKVTEATVSAYVKSNKQLAETKQKCLDKDYERKMLNISRRAGFTAKRAEIKESVTNPKLERLRERLFSAEITFSGAKIRLKELKSSLKSYQLLVKLYTAGLIK